eukprot:COSAG04_NODE_10679_length_760_cov_0.579425_2_plen_71_part_00
MLQDGVLPERFYNVDLRKVWKNAKVEAGIGEGKQAKKRKQILSGSLRPNNNAWTVEQLGEDLPGSIWPSA